MLSWHVARTEHGRSFIAEEAIAGIGFEVFNPKTREERQWSRGRVHETVKPVISGYIFARFDFEIEGWQKINEQRGVVGLMLSNPEIPARISDKAMVPLFGMCVDGYVMKKEIKRFVFAVGDLVKVTKGPFASIPGRVVSVTAGKIRAELQLFGRTTSLEAAKDLFEFA